MHKGHVRGRHPTHESGVGQPQSQTDVSLVASSTVSHQRRLRTTNPLERINQELKRRTRVARVFPNEASLLRLVSALLSEISQDWETGKLYLNLSPQIPPST